jgi:hypothetical protein
MFAVRDLEPGEPHRCLDCGLSDPDGSYGPQGLESIRLPDGAEHTVALADLWFCARHSARRWKAWLDSRQLLQARRRRLYAFQIAEAVLGRHRGHLDGDLFATAERWLRKETG